MNYNLPETPSKIPPDIFTDAMQLTVPTVFINKAAKAAEMQTKLSNQQQKDENLQKKQDVKSSIANLIIILKTINIELQYEQDQKTYLVLSQ
jgi:hypothetical protein